MGLIKESRNVDFYVIDKPWSDVELKEFSELIKLYENQHHKKKFKPIKTNLKFQKVKV